METHISRAQAAYRNVRLCMGTGTSRSVCPSFCSPSLSLCLSVSTPVSLSLSPCLSLWVSVPGAKGRPGPLGSRRTSLSCRMVGVHLDSQLPFLSLLKKKKKPIIERTQVCLPFGHRQPSALATRGCGQQAPRVGHVPRAWRSPRGWELHPPGHSLVVLRPAGRPGGGLREDSHA